MEDSIGMENVPESPEPAKPEPVKSTPLPNGTVDIYKMPPLPSTRAELEAQRKVFIHKSINDVADECHGALWDDPEYQKWFKAIYDAQSIEGRWKVDQYRAAEMVRAYAVANNVQMINEKTPLHAIFLALNVVRRRLGIDVTTRQNMIGDTIVPGVPPIKATDDDEL